MDVEVGIDAIAFYTPAYYLDLQVLAQARQVPWENWHLGLGQRRMGVLPPDEDIISMAAQACSALGRLGDLAAVDLLLFATESSLDQSKAAGLYVHKLLRLPGRCRVLELKQACYGATAGLQLALNYLRCHPTRKVLLVASDSARYGLGSRVESSQGSAAVAMLLSANPRLLTFDPETAYHAEEAMDFWRPNYRDTPFVEGRFSCELYIKLLLLTWTQYAELSKRQLSDHPYFCYHVPVPRLVEKAHRNLWRQVAQTTLSDEELARQVGWGLHHGRLIGNCYSAALYLSLISLLDKADRDLSHQRVGFYSYGSGCIGEFFSGNIQPSYRQGFDPAYHQALLDKRQALGLAQYEAFYQFPYPEDGSQCVLPTWRTQGFRLARIESHKRYYEYLE